MLDITNIVLFGKCSLDIMHVVQAFLTMTDFMFVLCHIYAYILVYVCTYTYMYTTFYMAIVYKLLSVLHII